MNICSYSNVKLYDERGINDRFRLLFTDVCYLLSTSLLFNNDRSAQVTLTAGVSTTTISGLTTSSRAQVTFVSIGGTVTTTWQYKAVCTANTLTITAIDNTGATNTLDTSVLNFLVIN